MLLIASWALHYQRLYINLDGPDYPEIKQLIVRKCAHNETSSAHTNIRTNTAIPEEFMFEGIFPKEAELVQTQRF
jgi:hypothetical protein